MRIFVVYFKLADKGKPDRKTGAQSHRPKL